MKDENILGVIPHGHSDMFSITVKRYNDGNVRIIQCDDEISPKTGEHITHYVELDRKSLQGLLKVLFEYYFDTAIGND